jgi:L-ascorbate metabolism protein UlaG (beta-lactamase superfamily)
MPAEKGAVPGFEGTINSHLANPLVDLPVSMDEILDVDAVIVTHIHPDHWDEAAINLVPKDMLIFTQNEKDAAAIQAQGFSNIRVLGENTDFDGITLIKTPGQHGRGKRLKKWRRYWGTYRVSYSSIPMKKPFISPEILSGMKKSKRI